MRCGEASFMAQPDPGSTQPDDTPPSSGAGERLLAWFIDTHQDLDPDESLRARMVVATALGFVAVAVLLLLIADWGAWRTVLGLPLPQPGIAGVIASIPINLSVAYAVKRAGSADRAAILLPISLLVIGALIAATGGGPGSPITWWMTAVPLLAAFLTGTRATLLTAWSATAVLIWFNRHELLGPTLGEVREGGLLRYQLPLLAFVTFIAWFYERRRAERARVLTAAYTHLERTHQALTASQRHITQIAENIGHAVWMYDADEAGVLYANSAYERLFGHPREQLADDPERWHQQVHPDDRHLLGSLAPGHEVLYRLLGDEDPRWVRHTVHPVHDGLSEHRTIHIAEDITDHKRVEQMRARYVASMIEVQEAERKHLARELHDETGQSLTALLVGLRTLELRLEDPGVRSYAQMLRSQLSEVVSDISRLAKGLHPAALDELGLASAVNLLVEDASHTHGLRGELRTSGFDGAPPLAKPLELTAYRIAQESIANIAKHAKASALTVSLDRSDTELVLTVTDDGVGFDPGQPRHAGRDRPGLGLMSMHERAALHGGRTQITSSPGQGTTVRTRLPLPEAS